MGERDDGVFVEFFADFAAERGFEGRKGGERCRDPVRGVREVFGRFHREFLVEG